MRKWILGTLVLIVVPVLSFGGLGGQDVGKLRPVQVVAVSNSGEGVQLLTDTEDIGIGQTVLQAVVNMKQASPAEVFLETADYLLIGPGAEIWIDQLQEYLRPSCSVCYVSGDVDMEQVGQYLQLHDPEFTLTRYEAGETRFPYLISKEGRMTLVRS